MTGLIHRAGREWQARLIRFAHDEAGNDEVMYAVVIPADRSEPQSREPCRNASTIAAARKCSARYSFPATLRLRAGFATGLTAAFSAGSATGSALLWPISCMAIAFSHLPI